MTDGDGILGAKTSDVSGDLLLIEIYLEGPIEISWLPSVFASTDCYGLRCTVHGA